MELLLISLASIVAITTADLNGFKPMAVHPRQASKRQGNGYSTSIIHQNPKNPEQTAESSVDIKFNADPEDITNTNKKTRQTQHYLFPKTLQNYQKQEPFLQQVPKQQLISQGKQQQDSQLFNVGYSMSFANDAQNFLKPKFQKPLNADSGDIITGTRKGQEFVQKPASVGFQPPEFVSNSIQDNVPRPGFSPVGQKYYQSLANFQASQAPISAQKSVSPWETADVEVLKSTELTSGSNGFGPDRAFKPSQQFDHASALGKSVGFDFTNGVDASKYGRVEQNYNFPQLQANTNSGPVTFDGKDKNPFANLQTSASNPIAYTPNGKLPAPSGNPPKFPIDTRLLSNPIPIHFDTRFIQEAMTQETASFPSQQLTSSYNNHFGPQTGLNPFKPTLEQGLLEGSLNSYERTKPVQEETQDFPQPKYKIYGKPQPSEKAGRKKVKNDHHHPRQPRHHGKPQTHLRPPPVGSNFQRKAYITTRL